MLLDPESPPSNWEYSKSKFKFIDLFAGIGGMRIAFESVGGTCVFTSEWDANAQKTYEANFGDTPDGDITKVNEKNIPDFDVLLAGFPCQPFSSIGQREGFKHKTQGTLFYDVLRIIEHSYIFVNNNYYQIFILNRTFFYLIRCANLDFN
jgi:DNA (cytosine-5)-methyltransferase 1